VEYRQNDDAFFFRSEINTVWKAACDDASNVFANNRKLERMSRSLRYTTLDLCYELKRKTDSLGFIPSTCLNKLFTRGAVKSNRQIHCLILESAAAFTSLQGTTSSGLAR